MWREEFGRGVVRVDIEPLSGLPFRAAATLRALPGLRTIAYAGSPVRNRRTPAQTADGDDCIGLFVNLGRRATASQRGRDVVLGSGDAVLISHEPSVVTPSPSGFVGVIVPHAALASRVRDIDDATMRLIPHGSEPLQLLTSYISLLPKTLVLWSPKLRRMVVRHIYDLVALALSPHGATREGGPSAIVAARLASALGHIAESFEDPSLTVAAVASRQRISPRYLQHLLETSGTSFAARVNELRLQRAFTLLTKACDGTGRISDIALQAGFSDISHFNRLFRSRFGDTPSAVRAEGPRHGERRAQPPDRTRRRREPVECGRGGRCKTVRSTCAPKWRATVDEDDGVDGPYPPASKVAITWSSLNATTRGAVRYASYHDRAGYCEASVSGPRGRRCRHGRRSQEGAPTRSTEPCSPLLHIEHREITTRDDLRQLSHAELTSGWRTRSKPPWASPDLPQRFGA